MATALEVNFGRAIFLDMTLTEAQRLLRFIENHRAGDLPGPVHAALREVLKYKPQPKFKVGDVCKIVGSRGHDWSLPIGRYVIVRLVHPDNTNGEYIIDSGDSSLYTALEKHLEFVR